MFTIFFVDDGQDFLEWDVSDCGEVVDCRPFQGDVWIGTIIPDTDIKPGDYLQAILLGGEERSIIHKVEKVQELV